MSGIGLKCGWNIHEICLKWVKYGWNKWNMGEMNELRVMSEFRWKMIEIWFNMGEMRVK
jgi:hypothetical protein